ncbi:hypothetical protein RLIN73S_00748 [Rhodanobacter lindaniclasticus]
MPSASLPSVACQRELSHTAKYSQVTTAVRRSAVPIVA